MELIQLGLLNALPAMWKKARQQVQLENGPKWSGLPWLVIRSRGRPGHYCCSPGTTTRLLPSVATHCPTHGLWWRLNLLAIPPWGMPVPWRL